MPRPTKGQARILRSQAHTLGQHTQCATADVVDAPPHTANGHTQEHGTLCKAGVCVREWPRVLVGAHKTPSEPHNRLEGRGGMLEGRGGMLEGRGGMPMRRRTCHRRERLGPQTIAHHRYCTVSRADVPPRPTKGQASMWCASAVAPDCSKCHQKPTRRSPCVTLNAPNQKGRQQRQATLCMQARAVERDSSLRCPRGLSSSSTRRAVVAASLLQVACMRLG